MSQTTLSRRELLEWLGTGAVLALGADLVAACGNLSATAPPDGGFDAAGDAQPADTGTAFPFRPGEGRGGVFAQWGVRTVDAQDLTAILASWQLRVDGLVETPATFGFADLVGLPRQDQVTDFHCVEGWSVYDVPWNGVHLTRLFDRVEPTAQATHVVFHTVNGIYNESLPLDVALEPRTLLAYGVGEATIPFPHGFPLRVVIPRLLGYKNAKYVERIELADHKVEGFWVQNGYAYDGTVPASRLREGKY
ncbi:MAG TPA: molybdopterin-dependent oxidoreductase [Polyangia bacterium]